MAIDEPEWYNRLMRGEKGTWQPESTVEGTLKAFETIVDNFNPGYTKIENNYIDNWDLYFFKIANLVARKSKDISSHVGSVIVKDKRILSTGYNGFCVGVDDKPERYNDRSIKYSFIAHSEFNACIVAAKFGISLSGGTIYTQSLACENCAKSIIQSGLKTIKTLKNCEKIWINYNKSWVESKKISEVMFKEAGVDIVECDIECGDTILIGGKIYNI